MARSGNPPRRHPAQPPIHHLATLPNRRKQDRGPAACLTTVINRVTAQLATLTDGRQRKLAAIAYRTGGLWCAAEPPRSWTV